MSSSPFPSCFRPTTTNHHHLPPPSSSPPLQPPPPPPPISGKSNLTTCLYQTELGLFSLTWSRSFLGHSLHLNLHSSDHHNRSDQNTLSPLSLSTQLSLSSIVSFHLHLKPYLFRKKHGSKNLHIVNQQPEPDTNLTKSKIKVLWDLSGAKFGSGPEPVSGFYVVVVANREIVLLVGDKVKEACNTIRSNRDDKFDRRRRRKQVSVLREEHLYGDRVYVTKAWFGNKSREISIYCDTSSDACLCFYVDRQRVLKVKRLKWKFRGNERIIVDGVPVNVSWDVHSWFFYCSSSSSSSTGRAVFMFRFETLENEEERGEWGREWCFSDRNSKAMSCYSDVGDEEKNGGVDLWQQKSVSAVEGSNGGGGGGGGGGISSEWKRIRKSLMKMRTARSSSSSSISMSSASSGSSSSIMEWSSVEENELTSAVGFSLLVYAWRK